LISKLLTTYSLPLSKKGAKFRLLKKKRVKNHLHSESVLLVFSPDLWGFPREYKTAARILITQEVEIRHVFTLFMLFVSVWRGLVLFLLVCSETVIANVREAP